MGRASKVLITRMLTGMVAKGGPLSRYYWTPRPKDVTECWRCSVGGTGCNERKEYLFLMSHKKWLDKVLGVGLQGYLHGKRNKASYMLFEKDAPQGSQARYR